MIETEIPFFYEKDNKEYKISVKTIVEAISGRLAEDQAIFINYLKDIEVIKIS